MICLSYIIFYTVNKNYKFYGKRRIEMKAIVNANIVLPNGILWDGAVLIDEGKIKEVKSRKEIAVSDSTEIINAEGAYVGPGFVDIHVHNGNGFSTSYHTAEAAKYFLKHHLIYTS